MWAAAGSEVEVGECEMWVVVACAAAGAVLEPGDAIGGTPGTEDERHVAVKWVGHAANVSVVNS